MEAQSKNRVSITIMGEEYLLKGSSSAEQMQKVGRYVDQLMKALAENNMYLSRHKIAVLAALNIADELFKVKGPQTFTPPGAKEEKTDHELA